MSLLNLSVEEFLNEVDSSSPAPGGGSVSAVSSLMGLSLIRMFGHLTVGKKKFKNLEEYKQEQFLSMFNQLGYVKDELTPLVDKDTEAFNEIMRAFKLPKETDEEKVARKQAILDATYLAIDVPLTIARLSYKALTFVSDLFENGNKNAITDFGVGINLVYNGLEGACLNVLVNVPGLTSEADITKFKAECEELMAKGLEIKNEMLEKVNSVL